MKTAAFAALLAVSSIGAIAYAEPAPAPVPAKATKAAAPALKLERVVMMMRHGIRPPTKANPVPKQYSNEIWPSWTVDYGLLTQKGASGVRLLGAGDRAYFASRGLFDRNGCPAPGAVSLQASGKSRAIRTAENWRDGFMPGCGGDVSHPTEDGPDPIFHGLDDKPAGFDGQRAYRDALKMAPRGDVAADVRAYRADLQLIAKVLNCAAPCALLTDPNKLVAVDRDRPELDGPVDVGSTASQTFLLEYLEGMPMKDVGWGRITRPEIERLLKFHPLKFKYSNRPDYVARVAAAPLMSAMLDAMNQRGPVKLALFAGHDTNIADIGAFLKIHWKVPSYPADDVPPGSALGFEILKDAKGTRYVRAFYRAQTMDQLREQRRLTGPDVAFRQYLAIADCGNSFAATACTLDRFTALVKTRRIVL